MEETLLLCQSGLNRQRDLDARFEQLDKKLCATGSSTVLGESRCEKKMDRLTTVLEDIASCQKRVLQEDLPALLRLCESKANSVMAKLGEMAGCHGAGNTGHTSIEEDAGGNYPANRNRGNNGSEWSDIPFFELDSKYSGCTPL